MALLIAFELLSMLFTTDILSAVRSFVGGEGIWSKAQKDSIQSLHKYAFTSDRKYYLEFQEHLLIPYGDRRARLEMQKPDFNEDEVREGFIQGQIHPDDINGLIRLFRRFHQVSYIKKAITIWSQADALLDELIFAAAKLDVVISQRPRSQARVEEALLNVDSLNKKLTVLENEFSAVLGEGSRWLEGLLRYLLLFAVLIVESTGLYFTFSFSRNLSRSIKEMSLVAKNVGSGDFSKKVPVQSKDELGQLASTINKMTDDLENSIGRRQKAENENQIKTLFLANMSHEIRTPLGIILGLTEALKQPDLTSEEQTKFIETIERTGHDLKQIVNDILDISKVEAGYLDIEKTRFSLTQFLEELHSALSAKAVKSDNTLVFETNTEIQSDMVFTDRIRLRQILTNILGNALKFTKKGAVKLTWWCLNGQLHFRVSDTGIGITKEQSKQLFQAFSQLDSSTTRQFGGTGLGLFLSRNLAIMLGGNIILEYSTPSKGSSFLITVESDLGEDLGSQNASQNVNSEKQRDNVLKGKKILIVDDSADNQLLMQFFLKKWNIDFESAVNGKEGVDKACAGDFDLVLMDIQMPLMDGYQATQELRKRNFSKPINALTAHAMKVDQDRCLQAGCDEYLTKPIDLKQIHQTLVQYLSDQRIR